MPINPKCPVPYHATVYAEFLKVREEQAKQQGRKLTETNDRAARVIFETGVNAVLDVVHFIANGKRPGYVMRVASLGTGTGKSTNAVALVAAYARRFNDTYQPRKDFSAAFVVPTVQLAKETVRELSALLPTGETGLVRPSPTGPALTPTSQKLRPETIASSCSLTRSGRR